jgi:aerobic C4-dicarboxylate transport protein
VISMSENACHRETLTRMLDAKPDEATDWEDLKVAKRV